MSGLSESELSRLDRFLSAHAERFALALVRIPQLPIRDEFSTHIVHWCEGHGRLFRRFQLAGLKADGVWERIRSGIQVGAVALLDDLDAAFHEPTGDLASLLNRQRERIAELLPGPVLLVLGEGALNRLFVDAPDLADWHAANFEFDNTPRALEPAADYLPVPELSAEWIESRIALLRDQLSASSLRDRSRARILMELADLYRQSVYAASSHQDRPRPHDAFEGVQLAEAALREAVAIQRRLAEEDPGAWAQRDLVTALDALAQLLKEDGRYGEAEPVLQEALQLCRVLGNVHPATLRSMGSLAGLYVSLGRYADAEPLYLRELAGSEKVLGAEHPSTLRSMHNLARLYEKQGRYGDAEPLYNRVLAADRRLLGHRHPSTLAVLNNLSGLYAAQGKYTQAESLHQEVLFAAELVLGVDHPDTLAAVNNHALLLEKLNRYAEAEQLYHRVVASCERILGYEHPDTLASVNNLALLFLRQGRHAEAELLCQRALAAREHVLGAEHPDTLTSVHNLAGLYYDQARYAEAERLYRRVIAASERVLGDEHPRTLMTVASLAALCEKQGRYSEAESLYKQAAHAAEAVLGDDHPNTKIILKNLAHLHTTVLTAESSPSLPETTPGLC